MQAILHHTRYEAPHIRTFFFTPEYAFGHKAGQYVRIAIPYQSNPDIDNERYFTISSAPHKEMFSITTKLGVTPSDIKQCLWQLRPGDTIEISNPMGSFILPKDIERPQLYIAGGLGVIPFKTMAQTIQKHTNHYSVQLIYCVRNQQDIIFRSTLENSAIETTYMIGQSPLTVDKIRELTGDISGKLIYISGPEAMISSITKQLISLGIDQDSIVVDLLPSQIVST